MANLQFQVLCQHRWGYFTTFDIHNNYLKYDMTLIKISPSCQISTSSDPGVGIHNLTIKTILKLGMIDTVQLANKGDH